MRYSKIISPSRILLKYVYMPGVNDNVCDYYGLIESMRKIGCNTLIITPNFDSKTPETDLECAKAFSGVLKQNGIRSELYLY